MKKMATAPHIEYLKYDTSDCDTLEDVADKLRLAADYFQGIHDAGGTLDMENTDGAHISYFVPGHEMTADAIEDAGALCPICYEG